MGRGTAASADGAPSVLPDLMQEASSAQDSENPYPDPERCPEAPDSREKPKSEG